MIDFEPDPEQRQLQSWAHEFAEREIRPVAARYDEEEAFPWPLLERAARIGLTGYQLPQAYGGSGVTSLLSQCLVNEEIFWGCAAFGTILGGIGLAATPILEAGTEEQRARWLPRLASRDGAGRPSLGAYAITEPEAGSDVAALRTRATRTPEGYRLTGVKRFITNGGLARVCVVFATVDPKLGRAGITAFLLPGDAPGLRPGRVEAKMGIRASQTAELVLEEVPVPEEDRLGQEGQGFAIAMATFERSRPLIAAGAVGLARAAFELALDFARRRRQFGRPILDQQAVRFKLAEMAMEIEAARLLTWLAAQRVDRGLPANREAAMAKAYAADMAMRVTTEAVQVLGGSGYTRDYPAEKWMRDAKVMQLYEGTSEIQRVIIGQSLAREGER